MSDSVGPVPDALKILVAGGFGAGKTTLVSALSEVESLHTEEVMTAESVGVDDLDGVESKTTTTVALDFGRITLDERTVIYMFGTPGQKRFSFMWEELAEGRSAPLCWLTPDVWRTASTPSTSSSSATFRLSWR